MISPDSELSDVYKLHLVRVRWRSHFEGYIVGNYLALQEAFQLTRNDIAKLAVNSFKAAFISQDKNDVYIDQVKKSIQ